MNEPTPREQAQRLVAGWMSFSTSDVDTWRAFLVDRIARALAEKDEEIRRLRRIMTGGDQVVLDWLREELAAARAQIAQHIDN